jgi:hypothetical protein
MTKEQIRLLDFNNGIIYRYKPNGDLVKVGSKKPDGYLQFEINGKKVYVHRYLYEQYHNITLKPDEFINHKNHIRDDNRIENLEVVNNQQNSQYRENVVGVCWNKNANKWQAEIMFNYEKKHLGYFDKFDDARKSRKDAENYLNEFHGAKFNI